MIKKIFFSVIAIMGISIATVSAKTALYSDIDTYINHYPINAYAVDGKMTVVAEDLRDYGFNVVWDEGARALHISRNHGVTQLVRKDVYDPKYASGTKMSDIYPSDIKVDYEGVQLTSYALNGYTMIPINDFAALAGREEWLGDIRAYKVWIDGLSVCDYKPLTRRCVNLWYNSDWNEMPDLSLYNDMDSDGADEKIELKITGKNNWDGIGISLKVGDEYIRNIVDGVSDVWNIEAVYLADLIPNDGTKEIAVYTMECSGDPFLRLFRYSNGELKQINFKIREGWTYDYEYSDYLWTGYIENYIFDVNDDGSFIIQEQTDSMGMWDVLVPYKMNSSGDIERVYQSSYPVVANTSYGCNEWGYWHVDNNHIGYGISLYRGEWIKPVYDDMKGGVYIQKNDGTGGWLYDGDYSLRHNASSLFWMAG